MLKLGIPFLPWRVCFAVLIEPDDSEPGTVGAGLTGLGIEVVGKGVCLSEYGTIALHLVLAMPRSSIHKRKHLLRMNCVMRMASSMAAYCACVPPNLYS